MSGRRRKAAWRISLLATATLTAAIAAGLVTRHKHALHAAALQDLRRTGFAAALAGDDTGAIAALAPYVAECPADAPASVRFARSRAAISQPDGLHLRTAILTLNQVLRQSPHDTEARHALLQILPQTADTDTLERVDDEALDADLNDPTALQARVIVCVRRGRLDAALAAARAAADASPDDIDARLTVMRLIDRTHGTAADVAAYAESQFNDADPRRLLLRSAAAQMAGDKDAARAALLHAVGLPTTDPAFALRLADALDDLGAFDATRGVLFDAARRSGDAAALRALAVRLCQAGQAQDVIAGLPGFDPAAPSADPQLLAVLAIAQFETGHRTDGKQIVEQLATRHDRASVAWSKAIAARYDAATMSSSQRINAWTRVLATDALASIVHAWLADTATEVGDPAAALTHWTAAAIAAPAWAAAHAGRADALLALGDPVAAADAAQSAFERGATVPAAVRVIVARFAAYDQTADPAAAAELLDATARVQSASPLEPTTLAIRATLLARLGRRDEATAALRAAAESNSLGAAGALRLAACSAAEDLGVEDQLLDRAPATPAVVLARATALATRGRPDAGHALLLAESGRAAQGDRAAALEWKIAFAQFTVRTHGPDGVAQWRTLQADYADRIDVQRVVVDAEADRACTAAALESLQRLGADVGPAWKLARAGWLIDAATPDALSEAVSLLSDVVGQTPRQLAAHLELARALRRAGNVATATEQLRIAQAIAPRDPRPLAGLVRLLQESARGDEAMTLLHQAAAAPAMSLPYRLATASLSADAGDMAGATKLLAKAPWSAASRQMLARIDPRDNAATSDPRVADLAALIAAAAAGPENAAEAAALRDVSTLASADVWPALKTVAVRFPADLALQRHVAAMAAKRDEIDVALAAARRGVSARPLDPAALALPVGVLRRAGRWAEMRAAADRWANALGPRSLDADAAAAEALLGLRRPADAFARLLPKIDSIRGTMARRPWPAIVFARVAVANGTEAIAFDVLRSGLSNAAVRTAVRQLAATQLSGGFAADWLDAADAATPDAERVAALSARAAVARRTADIALARSTLAAADAFGSEHPGSIDIDRVRAGLLQQLGRPNAAIAAVRSVLDARPADAAAHNDLACLLLDTGGDLADAARHANAAVAANPRDAGFHDTLARVDVRLGRREAAMSEYQLALKLDPTAQAAAEGLAMLRGATVTSIKPEN